MLLRNLRSLVTWLCVNFHQVCNRASRREDCGWQAEYCDKQVHKYLQVQYAGNARHNVYHSIETGTGILIFRS